jgi:hypothetical protein
MGELTMGSLNQDQPTRGRLRSRFRSPIRAVARPRADVPDKSARTPKPRPGPDDRVRAREFRIELHADGEAVFLANVLDVFAHHATLVPYATKLRQAGCSHGELVLIDGATGRVVARRRVGDRR